MSCVYFFCEDFVGVDSCVNVDWILYTNLNSMLNDESESDEGENVETYSCSTFSYYSMASTVKAVTAPHGFSNYAFCVQSSLKWRAALLSRRRRKASPVLSEEDLEFLVDNTSFSADAIKEWFREFIMDCPDGVLTKEKVLSMLMIILPRENGQIVADLIFTAFDKDKNGWIDFNEFIIATHCTATSSPKDKLHWVFQMYDKDKSQTIQLAEMVELFGTLYLNEGLEKDLAVDRAMAIFSTLDVNNDGDVTEDEFVRGCLEDEDLVRALSDKSSEPPLVVQLSADSTPRGMASLEMAITSQIRPYTEAVVEENDKDKVS